MQGERWERIQTLFDQALRQPEEQRRAWLEQACAGDRDLLDEVASLLDADSEAELSRVVSGAAHAVTGDVPQNRQLGPYRLIREIGRGGMGTVYLAERSDGEFEQRVAIKVSGSRFPGSLLHERFQAERQILARLEHPHIARLLDGGTTDEQPYVVMEHVDGLPIDRYCEANDLSLERRLELFLDVCDAVHYAHRNLIVHRDIKPSNILINEQGAPKLLDFGIAKLLETDADAPETRTAERLLTPEYASPEQLVGRPVTPASDVYSLGLVLFRLLTGQRPFDVDPTSPVYANTVCTTEPRRPSRVAAKRGRQLEGDLDNIILKALRKEPERRYGTAAELAEDLKRHRDGLPVGARPDTWSYRAGKFVRRNAALVLAGCALVLALAAGAITSTVLALKAERQRERAERQAAIAREINDFLNKDLLALADPYQETNRDITLREVVDRAAQNIGDRLADQPQVEAGVRRTLGNTYENLGEYPEAERHYRRAAELAGAAGEPGIEALVDVQVDLGGVVYLQDRFEEARRILVEAIELGDARLPPDAAVMLVASNTLALVYDGMGQVDRAIEAMRDTVARHRRVLGDEHPETLIAINNLGLTYSEQDRLDEAEPLLREVMETRERTLGPDHPDTVLSYSSLGFLYNIQANFEEAEKILKKAIERGETVLGPDHPWQTNNLSLIADVYNGLGRLEEARESYAEAVERQTRSLGEDHFLTEKSALGLADVLSGLGDHATALQTSRAVLARRRAELGETHVRTLAGLVTHTAILTRAGRCDEVVAEIGKLADPLREAYSGGHRLVGSVLLNHGRCLLQDGRVARATTILEEAERYLRDALGPEHERAKAAAQALEQARAAAG